MKIAGKTYTPCVCYPVPEMLIPTVEKLVKEGKVYTFEERVFFQNGKIIEKPSVVKPILTTGKTKKGKKDKEIEDIPSPEEIADNPEEF